MWRMCSISTLNEIIAKSRVPSLELDVKMICMVSLGVKILFAVYSAFVWSYDLYNSSDHAKPDSNTFLIIQLSA